jgi:hypothetical protein
MYNHARRSADKLEETKGGSVLLQDTSADGNGDSEGEGEGEGAGDDADGGSGSSPNQSRASTVSQTVHACVDSEGGDGAPARDENVSKEEGAPTLSPPSAADSAIVQSYTYEFNFSPHKEGDDSSDVAGPDLAVREVATDWQGAVFGVAARPEEDTTGMQV